MEKRKRPKLYFGELESGTGFYFYRRPSTSTSKQKSGSARPAASADKAPPKSQDEE